MPDSAGAQFIPAFTGLGSPFWRADARGAITGLSRGVGRGQIARALVEALAYQVRAMTDAFRTWRRRAARASLRRRGGGDGSPALTSGDELQGDDAAQLDPRGDGPGCGERRGTRDRTVGFARRARSHVAQHVALRARRTHSSSTLATRTGVARSNAREASFALTRWGDT